MKVLIKTASGHVIYLDDRDVSRCMVVRDGSGQKLVLDAANSRVEIADTSGSTITMDGASGDITIRAVGKLLLNP
jgi:hypothetical protein